MGVVSSFNSKVIWTFDNCWNRRMGYWFYPHSIQKRYGLLKIEKKKWWWLMCYWFDPHSIQKLIELFDWLHWCSSITVTLIPKLIVDRSLSCGRCRLHMYTWWYNCLEYRLKYPMIGVKFILVGCWICHLMILVHGNSWHELQHLE